MPSGQGRSRRGACRAALGQSAWLRRTKEPAVLQRKIAAAFGLLLLAAVPARAQYFGRNNVQYDRFDFKILETPHFDVYYYPSEQQAAELAARMAERWSVRLSAQLDHRFKPPQPIILYASHTHFAQT